MMICNAKTNFRCIKSYSLVLSCKTNIFQQNLLLCLSIDYYKTVVFFAYSFLFTFFRYTKSLKFSAVCKLKCNPISVRWYNTNKSSTLFSPNVSFSQEAKFVLLPAADYDGCKNLSLHSTSYGPISGRRRRQHAQKTSSRMKRRNGLELTFC